MGFSQRNGYIPVRTALQVDDIDKSLSNRLWNNIYEDFFIYMSDCSGWYNTKIEDACKRIWRDFLNRLIDEIPEKRNYEINIDEVISIVKYKFYESKWNEKLDLIEFICSIESIYNEEWFATRCNKSFELECSGFRIVDQQIIIINSEEEISAIEDAIKTSDRQMPVKIHLETSLGFLANREKPDYRNSIKESISAVEAYCKVLSNDNKATLTKTLAIFEKNNKIHPSLKEAFVKLYGYTSDSGGIRHALTGDDIKPTMEDAKFMLVSCSAFINFLKAKQPIEKE